MKINRLWRSIAMRRLKYIFPAAQIYLLSDCIHTSRSNVILGNSRGIFLLGVFHPRTPTVPPRGDKASQVRKINWHPSRIPLSIQRGWGDPDGPYTCRLRGLEFLCGSDCVSRILRHGCASDLNGGNSTILKIIPAAPTFIFRQMAEIYLYQ